MASKNKRTGSDNRVRTTAELKGADRGDDVPSAAARSRRGGRETVDALVVAFVLAFLIRTFQAEAFVIPTGSMAPTLMGRHKDVFCDQCGTRFKVNSSDDAADQGPLMQRLVREGRMSAREAQGRMQGLLCVGGECPQCRHLMMLSDDTPAKLRPEWQPEAEQTANYSGDRLVVSKYAYSFTDPERWDVAVFKYPGDSQTNYIKRVTGLPGEVVRIFQGDLFVRPLGSDDNFAIAKKPAKTVLAMKQFVHDTHHEAVSLIDAGWPLAWAESEGWVVEKEPAVTVHDAQVYQPTYRGDAPAGETRWLRYRHTPPGEPVWRRVLGDEEPIGVEPKPQLVTDFTAYNTRLNLEQAADLGQLSLAPRPYRAEDLARLGVHWVGDLLLEAHVEVESPEGEVSLDLVEAGTHYGVTIDVATGEASLWRRAFESDEREELASVSTSVRGAGNHAVRLANFDNQLMLWVDGSLVGEPVDYEDAASDAESPAAVPRTSDADEGDLAPAGVAISGGKLKVDRLRLWRDGYYIAMSHTDHSDGLITDLTTTAFEGLTSLSPGDAVQALPIEPSLWEAFARRHHRDFDVKEGQLFVMGDNSGWSLDARLWAGGNNRNGGHPGGPYLERKQLVGKAICVYWPHSWYSVPFTRQMVPAWPNFEDMRLVR
ncbi:signal peptidase I [Botrimarina mediterranea]|uniref:Signal peptidase I n=1 Tax=Botrimarina mediterranea TaxID=2528022 RepID=A0A518K3S7_9BACT|nr:signal peptidase I [Botrimarina mediterranea]QDV72454.1 signal peptidase I [Botrimarina mediterranea]QDV77025.1 signal peptidase I [Planctomycetes bacterium K2D]